MSYRLMPNLLAAVTEPRSFCVLIPLPVVTVIVESNGEVKGNDAPPANFIVSVALALCCEP